MAINDGDIAAQKLDDQGSAAFGGPTLDVLLVLLALVVALAHCASLELPGLILPARIAPFNNPSKWLPPHRGHNISLGELTVGVLLGQQLEAVEEQFVLDCAVDGESRASAGDVEGVSELLAVGQGEGGQPVVIVPFKLGRLCASGPRGGAASCIVGVVAPAVREELVLVVVFVARDQAASAKSERVCPRHIKHRVSIFYLLSYSLFCIWFHGFLCSK
jgi:hypothetical protein